VWAKPAQHRLQRTAASPLAGMRREPAKVWVGKGVLPAPPLPLKPTVVRIYKHFSGFQFVLFPSLVLTRPPAANANRWVA